MYKCTVQAFFQDYSRANAFLSCTFAPGGSCTESENSKNQFHDLYLDGPRVMYTGTYAKCTQKVWWVDDLMSTGSRAGLRWGVTVRGGSCVVCASDKWTVPLLTSTQCF